MAQKRPNKEQLIEGILHSLHFGDSKKEDKVLINHLCILLSVPPGANLREFLTNEIDFSYLFARLLQFIEPFTQMLTDIYTFLAMYETSAQTASSEKSSDTELRQLLIEENVQDQLSFDLENFPILEEEVLQRIPKDKPVYDKRKALNHNLSPLFLTDQLQDFGLNDNEKILGGVTCPICTEHFRDRFLRIFLQIENLITDISNRDLAPNQEEQVREYIDHFTKAKAEFDCGLHTQLFCQGYDHWQHVYHEFLLRFEQISTEETWMEETLSLLRVFELPFWQKRSQLFEVWTLIHFLDRLRDFPIELNIREKKWQLKYAQATEPAAWIEGEHFQLAVWFQRRQSGEVYEKKSVMPDILFMGRQRIDGAKMKPLVLIECKEWEGKGEDEIFKTASYYHEQIKAEQSFYCNYLRYGKTGFGCKIFRRKKEVICDDFHPGTSVVSTVDAYFIGFLNKKLQLWSLL